MAVAPGRTVHPSRAAGAFLAVAAGLVAVVTLAWWWRTTSAIPDGAQAVVEAGRLTGLAAGVAVVGLVVLSARIGPLDKAIGAERLYAWHAWCGRYAITLVVAHLVLITAGYALRAGDRLGATILTFLADPGIVLGLIAAVAMVAVGVVSAIVVRPRLPYEAWQAIHLATYAAILLGVIHAVVQGAQFAGARVATGLWVTVTVVPVAILLVNRLVRPLIMNARCRFTVAAVHPEAPGVYSVVIAGRGLERVRAQAGQFVRVHAAVRGLRFASNPYSLSAPPGATWRITVAVVGNQSRRLVGLPVGTRLWLEGPYGGLILDKGDRPVLLVGGGTGVAPVRALAEAALATRPRVPVVVVQRYHDADAGLYTREWADLTARASGRLAVYQLAGPRTKPGNAVSPALVTAVAPWVAQADVYACGSAGLTGAVRDALRTTGAHSFRAEAFGW